MFNFIKEYFDHLYFAETRQILEKEISIRDSRIRDLEGHMSALLGEVNILRESIDRAQTKEDSLLNKIFELTGVNQKINIREVPAQQKDKADFIKLGRQGANWQKVREELEAKGLEDYWKRKNEELAKREAEKQAQKENGKVMGSQLSTEDNPLGLDRGIKEDANKVS